MNRSVAVKSLIFAIALGVSVFLAGCEEFASEEQFYTIKPQPEQTRQIQTLKLEPKADGSELLPDVNKPIEANNPPQKEVGLSLEQCRAMTLVNNLDLKVQLIAPAIAAQQVNAEEAKFEASFFSNLTYSDMKQPALPSSKSIDVDLGVEVPLRTGGQLTFDVADNWTKTNYVNYSATSSLSISQPLLRGAGKRVNTHSIRIAEYERRITDARTKLEVIRVLANADRGYWRLYPGRRELEGRGKENEHAE